MNNLAHALEPSIIDATRDRLRRASAQWTLSAIAKAGELSPTWVSEFSRGHYPNPGIRSLHKLVSALDRLEGECQ